MTLVRAGLLVGTQSCPHQPDPSPTSGDITPKHAKGKRPQNHPRPWTHTFLSAKQWLSYSLPADPSGQT